MQIDASILAQEPSATLAQIKLSPLQSLPLLSIGLSTALILLVPIIADTNAIHKTIMALIDEFFFSQQMHTILFCFVGICGLFWSAVQWKGGRFLVNVGQFVYRALPGVPALALLFLAPTPSALLLIVSVMVGMRSFFTLSARQHVRDAVLVGPALLIAIFISPVFWCALPIIIVTLPFISPWQRSFADRLGFLFAALAPLGMGLLASIYILWMIGLIPSPLSITFTLRSEFDIGFVIFFALMLCPALLWAALLPTSFKCKRVIPWLGIIIIAGVGLVAETIGLPAISTVIFAVTTQWAFLTIPAAENPIMR